MRAVGRHGLLLLLCLLLVGIPSALVTGGIWLVVQAPQALILGAVLLVICGTLAALVGNIASGRRG